MKEILKDYKKGDIIEGEITGVADFGAFIKFGEIEGLIHISKKLEKFRVRELYIQVSLQ